jgi:hypothetical protein
MSFRTKDGMVFPDLYAWRQHLLNTVAAEFERVFHIPMAQAYSITSGINFRAINITCKLYSVMWYKEVAEKYGTAGSALMETLTTQPKKITEEAFAQTRPNSRAIKPTPTPASPFAALFTVPPATTAPPTNGIASLFAPQPAQVEEIEEDEPEAPTGSIASLFK